MNEDDLRVGLRSSEPIAPLDPAKVIAGARHRRRVRALTAAGAACLSVVAVAAGVAALGGDGLGTTVAPAGTPTTQTPSAQIPTAQRSSPLVVSKGKTVSPHGAPALPVASCRQAVGTEPGPDRSARLRGSFAGPRGRLIVIADSKYWVACDNTYGDQVSVRQPERIGRAGRAAEQFAVAHDEVDDRDYFWAAGELPAGVARVGYTFPDGVSVDAQVSGGYWLIRHLSDRAVVPGTNNRIRVRLFSSTGSVLQDLRLSWGDQTCAQISHGC